MSLKREPVDALQVRLDDFVYGSAHPWVDQPPGVTYGKALEFTYEVILHACMGTPSHGDCCVPIIFSCISICIYMGRCQTISNRFMNGRWTEMIGTNACHVIKHQWSQFSWRMTHHWYNVVRILNLDRVIMYMYIRLRCCNAIVCSRAVCRYSMVIKLSCHVWMFTPFISFYLFTPFFLISPQFNPHSPHLKNDCMHYASLVYVQQ